ncbi:MAG TPA: hypothetical protein VEA80_14335 [Vitreimonas sp.]|uniref:hypothetical protein n=1 Tax=Vitreimonas sp. TaxID=3069702 RepID=UPI002D74E42F|nr:hypothetical protein [Vitreimonas sp.]HYD88649.1 hypothetical protein [Vitreimonas sp.]
MLALETKPRPQAPPAKRWRNYYRVYRVLDLWRLGTIFPGVHAGPDWFVSKDLAEANASAFLAALNPPGRCFMEHAGAFPDGDSAH